jgi:tetratricopeptide (TPR) repeat protein
MRPSKVPHLVVLLLLVLAFGMAAWLDTQLQVRQQSRATDVLSVLMGDSRRIFAYHFFVKADAYFHSGFYPTIFDNQESFQTPHMAEDAGALKGRNAGEETAFMGKPRDIIEEFNRHFLPATHTHLDEGGAQAGGKAGTDLGEAAGGEVREILPWLKLSAELDPNRIETYTVTAYWLRVRMKKVNEAEEFLRDGLRANPGNSALLFELGRIYQDDRNNVERARNLWELGVKRLDEQSAQKTEQDNFILSGLTLYLARLEEKQGNLSAALHWLERLQPVSPDPEGVAKQIAELREQLSKSPLPVGANAAASP